MTTPQIHNPSLPLRRTDRWFQTPGSVVRDKTLTLDEKRALLASWATDARAVRNFPALRRLDDGRLVAIDDILEALKQLDGPVTSALSDERPKVTRGHWSRLGQRWRRFTRDEDDDDDPPTPAPASGRPRRPVTGGQFALAA